MPKKLKQESQADQSARFVDEARRMMVDGELNPIDGERAVDSITRVARNRKPPESDDSEQKD